LKKWQKEFYPTEAELQKASANIHPTDNGVPERRRGPDGAKKTIIPTQYYFTHTNAGARSSLAPPFPLQTGLGFYRDQLYLDYLYPLPATAFSPQKPGA